MRALLLMLAVVLVAYGADAAGLDEQVHDLAAAIVVVAGFLVVLGIARGRR